MKTFATAVRQKGSLWLGIALITVLLASCLDDDRTEAPVVPVGYVSLYHAAPDGPALDVLVDNSPLNTSPFDYTDHSDYLRFYTGNRNLKFNVSNAVSSLIDTTFNIADGKVYSLFIVNTLPSGIEPLIIADSIVTPASDKAMIRFVNLSPDAPALDLSTSDANASIVASNTSFKDYSEFEQVDAGTYSFDVLQTGTQNKMLSANSIRILPGRFYTVVTRGFVNPPSGNTNVLSLEVL